MGLGVSRRPVAPPARRPAQAPVHGIAFWWTLVGALGIGIVAFSDSFLPDKAQNDTTEIRRLIAQPYLWDGLSLDGFVNTARVWDLVGMVVPHEAFLLAYYAALLLLAARWLQVLQLRSTLAHAMAGAWLTCAALFLSQPSKEMIALPVAMALVLPGSALARWAGAAVFLAYAAFFRQYWAITFFYYLAVLLALRLQRTGRPLWAIAALALAFATPFVAAAVADQPPLTDIRLTVNLERMDSDDARSAFDNPLVNTGAATDIANAVLVWFHLNLPLALLAEMVPHYVAFGLFQLASVAFFATGCRACLREVKRAGPSPGRDRALRCAALVIGYSMTLCIFEPDFGSFIRHQIVVVVPMLLVGCRSWQDGRPSRAAPGRTA